MKRTWPIRLLEFSPLIVLALMLTVWFGVPRGLRTMGYELLSMRAVLGDQADQFQDSFMTPDLEVQALRQLQSSIETNVVEVSPVDRLQGVADGATNQLVSDPEAYYDEQGRLAPPAIEEEDERFASIRDYERAQKARVAVFVMAPDPSPPVALSAVESTEVLTPAELAEFESSGTLNTLRRLVRGSTVASLPVDVEGLNGGTAEPRGERTVFYSPRVVGGRVYELYSIWPATDMSELSDYPELPDLSDLAAPANLTALRRIARHENGAVFVIGPTDAEYTPLRTPDSLEASAVITAAQESLAGPHSNGWGTLTAVPSEWRARLGGAKWMGTVLSYATPSTEFDSSGRPIARQPLAYVALYRTSPEIPLIWNRIGKTPQRALQVWLGANMLFVSGALAVAFLASLVASPLAFAYERRATAQAELERERERVRRQARERVVERLTELSEQVDAAAKTASGRTQREVADVASDIDSTVAELRSILGGLSESEASRDV